MINNPLGNKIFRQQTIKFTNENNVKANMNKNPSNMEDQREFGKDLTSVHSTNQENIAPNKDFVFQPKMIQLRHNSKEELANKLKNYNYNLRTKRSKTVNEVITTARNGKDPLSNVIVNNEILAEAGLTTEMDYEMHTIDNEQLQRTDSLPVETATNPQLVEEYLEDIFSHLKEVEFLHLPSPNYMKRQTDINEKMRAILTDWLVEVHLKFKLLPETLFLTINLIDRYLERKVLMRNKLQLVGVTSMLIACKYEEIYAPEVRDFVYITDKAYTKEEILQMENDILSTLEYNVTVPSSFRYSEVYNAYLKMDETCYMFTRYLLELFLIEYKMLKYNPSLLAASSIYITIKITKKLDIESLKRLTCYEEDKLKECAKEICVILDIIEKSSLVAVKKKFSLTKFLEVAKIKFN